MSSIRKKAAIQFFASNGATVVNFFLAIVMARLLSPEEIGIFSITAVIVSVSHVFRDFGVASYLKREKTLTPEILSAATGVLFASSWTIATLLYLSSSYVADYFAQPGIYDVMRVLAVGFYFIPFGSIPQALLQRKLATEKTAIVTAISTAVYAVSCITLATMGFSYMTMAWANLINIIVTGLALMALRPKDLPWFPSLRGWGSVAHFGVGSMLTSTLTAVDNAIPDTLLGKLSGAHNVGLFSRANSTVNIFNHISGPTIGYMALPYLAKSHHDGRDLSTEVGLAIAYLTGLIWSALAVTAVMAPDIIRLLYGEAWLDCVGIVPILCIACGVQATFAFMVPALTGIGRPYWSALPLVFSVTAKGSIASAIFDGTLESFAWAVAIGEFFAIPGHLYLARRYITLRSKAFVLAISRSLAIALVMLSGVALLKYFLDGIESSFFRLLIVFFVMTPLWIGAIRLFNHPLQKELISLFDLIVRKFKLNSAQIEQGDVEAAASNFVQSDSQGDSCKRRVLVYGVIARQDDCRENATGISRAFKRFIHQFIDRSFWVFGSTNRLDYRNYDNATTSNVGDMAIVQATRRQFGFLLGHEQFTNVNWGELSRLSPEEIASNHDLCVIAGSGYFFFDKQWRLSRRIADDLNVIDQFATPVVLYGVGVNQNSDSPNAEVEVLLSEDDEELLRRLLKRCTYISVRDSASQQLLSRYADKPVVLMGDPALWLGENDNRPDGKFSIDTRQRLRIGLNVPFHGEVPNQHLRRNLATYVKMLKAIQRETGCSFSYFVHYDTENLIPGLLAQKGIPVQAVRGTPEQLAQAYSDIDLHIGGMLHSCILAVGAGTPVIGLAYDQKHLGFFELMGISRYCFTAGCLEPPKIIAATLEIIHNRKNICAELAERRDRYRAVAEHFVRQCVALLPTLTATQPTTLRRRDPSVPPTVSVIIPVRNCRNYIGEAIDSVLRQDFDNFEILVVDDGSDDFDYRTLAGLDSRICVHRQEAAGVSHARNAAMRLAKGSYFAFLDADDVWFPGKLTAQVRYLEQHPEVGVVFGEFLRWHENLSGQFEPAARMVFDCSALNRCNEQRSGWLYTRLLMGLLVGMNTAMIRREVYRDIGGFDETLQIGEDHDYWLRTSRITMMDALDGPVALYRVHAQSAMRRIDRRNHHIRLMESARLRWGLAGPGVEKLSERQYKERLSECYFDHGYNHFWYGDPFIAHRCFFKALPAHSKKFKTAFYCALASGKVAFRSRTSFLGSAEVEGRTATTNVYEKPTRLITPSVGAPVWARLISSTLGGGLIGESRQALTIFTFHKLPGEKDARSDRELSLQDFIKMVRMLRRSFNLMPMEEGLERLKQNDLPPFSAALTFDDGYPNWIDGVVPALEAHAIPATFFISTGQLQGKPLWFERVERILSATSHDRHRLISTLAGLDINLQELRPQFEQNAIKAIKFLPTKRRDDVIQSCEKALGVDGNYPLFSEQDVLTLRKKGFSIGAHTVNHPILSSCTDAEARMEIFQSKRMLEDILREPISLFAYPNGVPGVDVRPQHVRMVREAGFLSAVTTASGSVSRQSPGFQLPRLDPWAKTPRRFMVQYLLALQRQVPIIPEELP